MGIEFSAETARPSAYHFRVQRDPYAPGRGKTRRVPSDRVLHVFRPDAPCMVRGFPWMVAACRGIENLRRYEEAELLAARLGASAAGFITLSDSGGQMMDAPESDDEAGLLDMSPGMVHRLAEGEGFEPWDPKHPTTQYGDFVAAQLRGIAAGCGVPYHELAEDWAAVNFSAARSAVLSHRPAWEAAQRLLIDRVCEPVFRLWVETAGDPDTAVEWKPRKWDHVQPREQATAETAHIANMTMSRTEIIRARGADPASVFGEIAAEEEMLRAMMPEPEQEVGDGDAG